MRLTVLLWFCVLLPACTCSDLKLPEPDVYVLGNGIKVFVLEDRTLPTFRLVGYFPGAAVWDESGKAGQAWLTATLIRTGGTGELTPTEVDTVLGRTGAVIEVTANQEEAVLGLRCLKEDRVEMVRLAAAMFSTPRFDPKALELARRQALVGLMTLKEEPLQLLDRHFPELIYGAESAWARIVTEASLLILSQEDIVSFYQHHYRPDQMILGVSGDFNKEELIQELEASLGGWTVNVNESAELQWPAAGEHETQALFMPKAVEQASIRLGHIGITRENPDKYAVLLANFVLGGSGALTSQLGKTIRSSQGQAYSVWSQYGIERVPGIFAMSAQTEASQTLAVIQSMQEVLKRLMTDGVSEEELNEARQSIVRALLFEYETRYGIVADWVKFEFRGYPRNYLQLFMKKIEEVDVATVNKVLKKYFQPDKLSLLVVGPEALWQPLTKLWPGITRRNP